MHARRWEWRRFIIRIQNQPRYLYRLRSLRAMDFPLRLYFGHIKERLHILEDLVESMMVTSDVSVWHT